MSVLPAELSTGMVHGRFIVAVIDGDDADQEPEVIPAIGRIVFKASVGYIPVPSTNEGPVTVMKGPITGVLDSEGYLSTPHPTTGEPMYRGVKLLATDDPDMAVTDWTWTADYRFESVNGVTLQIPAHSFALPSGTELDLTTLVKVPSSPGYGLPQAEAAVLRAEAAAIEASASADVAVQGASSTDDLIAGIVSDPSTQTSTALSAAIADSRTIGSRPDWATANAAYDNRLDAYNLRPDNLSKWRAARAKASAGLGQAHVSTFLDSITHGANTATSNPKYVNSWPGRMARQLKAQLGDGGTGIVTPWDSMPNTAGSPPHDHRFTFAGDVTNVSYGIYNRGAKRVTGADGTLNYIEFTATCDEFWVYSITSGSGALPRVQVDGGDIQTIGGTALQATPTYPPQPGYWGTVEGTGNGQIVSRIPVTLGQHTIRLMAPSTTGTLTVLGVEGRIAGKGVRVSNLAQSSRSMADMVLDDTAHHMSGLSVALDMPKADLSVMLLGMNDYQGHSATFKTRVATAIDRQRNGGTYGAHGDVILVTCPQPNYAAPIPADGILTPPLTDYYNDLYELADEKDVPLVDVASRWRNFETSNALGFFGDALHPNDLGSEDIARAVYNALMAV